MRKIFYLILMLLLEAFQAVNTNLSAVYQGSPWINSNILFNWPKEQPDVKDNFELSVNYDLYMEAKKNKVFYDSFFDRSEIKQEKVIKNLLMDRTKKSDELELLRIYIKLFTDSEKRLSDSTQPLFDYIDFVNYAENTEELSQVMQTGLLFGDPLAAFCISPSEVDENKYGVYVDVNVPFCTPFYDDDEMSKEDYVRDMYYYYLDLLEYAGYTEDQASQILNSIVDFVVEILPEGTDSSELNIEYKELEAFCKPLFDLATGLGYYSEDDIDVWFTIADPEVFRAMNNLYTDENLEVFKGILNIYMIDYAKDYLDIFDENDNLTDMAYSYINNMLPGAVDQIFLEYEFPEDIRETVTLLTSLYIEAMKNRILNSTWLFDSTIEKAVEKIDNMISVVVYPDFWLDFSMLLEQIKTKNRCLLDAVLCRDDYYRSYYTQYVGKDIERGNWIINNIRSTEANAYYMPSENSINILAGILYDQMYSDESWEDLLGTIGVTIGHEITHGFDLDGSMFDSYGFEVNWWTDADRSNFEKRCKEVASALDKIELLNGYYLDGEKVVNEMIADLGGMALSLDIARLIDNFDYEKFFKCYARQYYSILGDKEYAEYYYEDDEHAADYVRVNFVVQQFEEFYKAFDIKEGDAMYLSPELRVQVW